MKPENQTNNEQNTPVINPIIPPVVDAPAGNDIQLENQNPPIENSANPEIGITMPNIVGEPAISTESEMVSPIIEPVIPMGTVPNTEITPVTPTNEMDAPVAVEMPTVQPNIELSAEPPVQQVIGSAPDLAVAPQENVSEPVAPEANIVPSVEAPMPPLEQSVPSFDMPSNETVMPASPVTSEPAPTLAPTPEVVPAPAIEPPVVQSPASQMQPSAPEVQVTSSEVNNNFTASQNAPMPNATAPSDQFQATAVAPTLDPNLQPNQTTVAPVNAPAPETKSGKKKSNGLIIIILLIALIAIGVFVYFRFFSLTPKKAYNVLLEEYQTTTQKLLNNSFTEIDDGFYETLDFTIDTNLFGDTLNIALNSISAVDINNHKLQFDVTYSDNNKATINAKAFIDNNKLYINSSKIYNNTIYFDGVDYIDFDSLVGKTPQDYVYIINKVNNALVKSLDNATYSKENTTISLFDNNEKVVDNIMVINSENINTISNSFFNQLLNDDKFITLCSELFSYEKDDLIEELTDMKNDDLSIYDFNIQVHLYTKAFSNTVVGIDLKEKEKLVVSFRKNDTQLEISNNGYLIKATTNDQKTYDFVIEQNNKQIATGKYTTISDTEKELSFTVNDITVKFNVNYTKETNGFSYKIAASVNYDDYYFNISATSSIDYSKTVDSFNTSNARNYNSLSDNEKNIIFDNISNIFDGTVIQDLIDSFTGNDIEDYYNYDEELCEKASCSNCTSDTCTCYYVDEYFNSLQLTCPNPNYY